MEGRNTTKKTLLAFLLISILGGMISMLYSDSVLLRYSQETWTARLKAQSQALSIEVDSRLQEARDVLGYLSRTREFQKLNQLPQVDPGINGVPKNVELDKRRSLQTLLDSYRQFQVAFILNADGKMYLTQPYKVQERLDTNDLSSREYVQAAEQYKRPMLSDGFIGAYGIPTVAIATPIFNEQQQIRAYLGATIHLNELSKRLRIAGTGRCNSAFLVDGNNRLIAHSDPGLLKDNVLRVMDDYPVLKRYNNVYKARSGLFPDPLTGLNKLVAAYPLNKNWILGVERCHDTLVEETQDQLRPFIISIGLLLLLVSLLAAYVAQKIGAKDRDVRLKAERAVKRSEKLFRSYFDHLPIGTALTTESQYWLRVNDNLCRQLGYSVDELMAMHWSDVIHPNEQEDDRLLSEKLSRGEIDSYQQDRCMIRKDGSATYARITKSAIRDDKGGLDFFVAAIEDINERRRSEGEMRQFYQVFDSISEGIMITDINAVIVAVNPAFTKITGYSQEEALGRSPSFLHSGRQKPEFYEAMWKQINETGWWRGEIWNRGKDGEVFPEWLTISVVKDKSGKVVNYVSAFADITPIKRATAELEHLAHHHPLTNLPNRLLLNARLQHSLERAKRNNSLVAIMFIDLDRFKHINDSLGHKTGDEVLRIVAERLTSHVRKQDTVAHQSGDEFMVVMEELHQPQDAANQAHHFLEGLTHPMEVDNQELYIGASIGIAMYPQDGTDVDTLVRNADAAMYEAKAQGRNTYRFYTQQLTESARERVSLDSRLRRALEQEEFIVYYQPQIDLASNKLIGCEALIRWQHPDEGMISPARFIPMAEESGLILPIGEWVLHQACQDMASWRKQGFDAGRVAVNLAGRQLNQSNLDSFVECTLKQTGCKPQWLELEVTENFLMQKSQNSVMILENLQKMGIELAIDDFGTGYSSLSYLKSLPIDKLKIDQGFVRDITTDPNDEAIVCAIIALGHSLQLKVIAEGVETEAQKNFLYFKGCDQSQGYLHGRPMPADEFVEKFFKR